MKIKVRTLALTVLYAASYAGLVYSLAPISFMLIQVRVANALIGLVPILGLPAVYGVTLGVLIGNISSPLGLIDLLSVVPSFIGLVTVYKLRRRSVLLGLLLYSFIVSPWVAFMLYYVYNLPYLLTFVYVFTGISIATTGLGYIVYVYLSRIEFLRRALNE